MKYLFVVQGEGRGHLTQALSLADMLRRNGHEIIKVLVGMNRNRVVPSFFVESIGAPLERYISPNFSIGHSNKRMSVAKTVIDNASPFALTKYFKSMDLIHKTIQEDKPDVVINFYEVLAGMFTLLHKTEVPIVSLANQNMLFHPDYQVGVGSEMDRFFFRFYSVMCNVSATKLLAISFRPHRSILRNHLHVVPPIVRREVLELKPTQGDFILGYMLNSGYADEVKRWHKKNPHIPLHFFWDKHDAPEELKIDDNLTFHRLNDHKFRHMMEGCRAMVSTAGFGTISEALYLGKPILTVPAHVEQQMNADEISRMGYGIVSKKFDLSSLLSFMEKPVPENPEYRKWIDSSEELMIKHLTTFA